MMQITNHWIDDAIRKPSPNHGGIILPRLVVIHYTGSDSLGGALSWLCNRQSRVSAHVVIGKNGELYQLVPFNVAAWHAGRSEYDGVPGVNNFSVGIELVGIGDRFPSPQINRLLECLDAIVETYEIVDIVGHCDVAVPRGRKIDPGPKFPWPLIRDRYE